MVLEWGLNKDIFNYLNIQKVLLFFSFSSHHPIVHTSASINIADDTEFPVLYNVFAFAL